MFVADCLALKLTGAGFWHASHPDAPDLSGHADEQGLTAPSDPPGAEPSAPAGRRMAGGSPLHFVSLPVHSVVHCTKSGGRPPQHEDPDRGLQFPEGPVEPC